MRAVLIFLLLVAIAYWLFMNQPLETLAKHEHSLSLTQRLVGMNIAAVAAFVLLLRALAGETLDRVAIVVLPLLGGMLLVAPQWGLALGIAVLATVLFARDRWGARV